MDFASFLAVAVSAIVVYYIIRFVVSPLIKAVAAVVALLLAIYIIQYLIGFSLNRFLGPFAVYLDITKWGINLDWLLNPINYYFSKLTNK